MNWTCSDCVKVQNVRKLLFYLTTIRIRGMRPDNPTLALLAQRYSQTNNLMRSSTVDIRSVNEFISELNIPNNFSN